MAFMYLTQGRIKTRDIFGPVTGKNTALGMSPISVAAFDGKIETIRVHTANDVKYDFGLYTLDTALDGSVDNLYLITGIQQSFQTTRQALWFFNMEDPTMARVWFNFVNRSNGSTGDITVELIIQQNAKGTPHVIIPS